MDDATDWTTEGMRVPGLGTVSVRCRRGYLYGEFVFSAPMGSGDFTQSYLGHSRREAKRLFREEYALTMREGVR